MHGDEAGAETLHAGEVFIAAALVDLALAAEFGFDGRDRQAVRFFTAIAAAFADALVNDNAFWRVDHQAALAAAAFFGGAGGKLGEEFRHVMAALAVLGKFPARA